MRTQVESRKENYDPDEGPSSNYPNALLLELSLCH